jgi:cation-transporting P-type ATPase F
MTTAILLGLMLAFEPTEKKVMTRPPRDPKKAIITRSLVIRILLVSLIMAAGGFWIYDHIIAGGGSVAEARTVAVNVVVFTELFYLFNCRSLTRSPWALGFLSNRCVIIGAPAMALFQLIVTYVPVMNLWFDTAPIGGMEWLKILGVGLLGYFVIEIEKRYQAADGR